ncbi:MAG: hypothetical protein FWD90_01355 [Defluviitaleaceae bacterium]|nr:hypothetical protein [Defluviitaleaceae bacterium]
MYQSEKKFKAMFIDPNETFICAVGNVAAESFISTGKLKEAYGVLTNKRVYYRGRELTTSAAKLRFGEASHIVDIKDVTGTGYVTLKPIGLLFTGIVAFICALIIGIAVSFVEPAFGQPQDFLERANAAPFIFVGLLILGIFIMFYIISRRTYLEIKYAGGAIGLDVVISAQHEVVAFQRNLILMKDKLNNAIVTQDFNGKINAESTTIQTEKNEMPLTGMADSIVKPPANKNINVCIECGHDDINKFNGICKKCGKLNKNS